MPSQVHYQLLGIAGLLALVGAGLVYAARLNLGMNRRGPMPFTARGYVPRIVLSMTRAARVASVFCIAVPVYVLIGWTLRSPRMVSFVPGLVAMNPVVAVLVAICAIALYLLIDGNPLARRMAKWAGIVVAGAAIIKLAGFVIGHDTLIDQVLFNSHLNLVPGLPPNRMAPNTGFGLLLVGLALAMIDVTTRRGKRPAEMLAMATALIALLALVGYLYSVTSLYHLKTFIPMALHVAGCLFALSLGILFARPDIGMMSIITSDTNGGATARKLLPPAIIVPILLGWLREVGEQSGLHDTNFGISLLILADIFFFILLIWSTAGLLRQADNRRRQTEESLGHERNVLRNLIDNLPDHIYVKDASGHYVVDNVAHARFVGLSSPEQVVGKTVADLFPPALAEQFAADDRAVIISGEPLLGREEPIVDKDGTDKWVSTTKVPLRNTDGDVTGLVCISRDISRRRLAEVQMREMQDFLSSIIENIPHMVFVKDADELRFVRFNRAGEELLGQNRADLIGRNDYDCFPKAEADDFIAMDRSVLASGKMLDIPSEPIQTINGIRILHTKKIPIVSNGKPRYLLGISEDITDQIRAQELLHAQNVKLQELARSEKEAHDALKRAQGQMLQAEKLAALGELVAGVAHEINNPLSFVSNNMAVIQRDLRAIKQLLQLYQQGDADLTAAKPELMAAVRELCERIDVEYTLASLDEMMGRSRDGLKRIQQIVKDLRDFARLDESDLHEVDLNQGIESTVNIIRGRAKSKQVKIELDLQPLPLVACYPAKINQVVMNLVANAIDACSAGGTVTVRSCAPAGTGHVRLEVIDNGSGIDPAVRDRIFNPFFTTKPQGEGTGLGLSISYGIIRDHHGNIEVDSTPAQGSRFSVTIPIRGNDE